MGIIVIGEKTRDVHINGEWWSPYWDGSIWMKKSGNMEFVMNISIRLASWSEGTVNTQEHFWDIWGNWEKEASVVGPSKKGKYLEKESQAILFQAFLVH